MSQRGPAVLLSFALAACTAVPPGTPQPLPAPLANPQLLELPARRWVKIHQQAPGDVVTFVRQKHGGSAYDSRRGQLVLFGSDTHARNNWIYIRLSDTNKVFLGRQ